MTFDPFVAAIQALPNTKLSTLGREIDAQIAELQDQSQKVRQVLASRQTDDEPSPSPARSTRPQRSQKRGKRGIGKKRQARIKEIVSAEPGKQWLPSDLEARLHAAGDTAVTKDSIRNIVRDMIHAGELARHSSGNGATASGLASTNGSEQEPLTEAQS